MPCHLQHSLALHHRPDALGHAKIREFQFLSRAIIVAGHILMRSIEFLSARLCVRRESSARLRRSFAPQPFVLLLNRIEHFPNEMGYSEQSKSIAVPFNISIRSFVPSRRQHGECVILCFRSVGPLSSCRLYLFAVNMLEFHKFFFLCCRSSPAWIPRYYGAVECVTATLLLLLMTISKLQL